MLRTMKTLLLATALVFTTGLTAQAALQAVGPVSLQNGYPVWWQDQAVFRVAFCLDAACFPDPVQAGNPFSEQVGFGAEAFWWLADATLPVGNALLVLAQEAAWLTETARDGEQFPFARIRVRADADAAGVHTITHPYGQIVVNVTTPGTRAINVTLDIPAAADPPLFAGALATDITHFLRIDNTPVPAPGAVFSGTGTIANAGTANAVFSISGPGIFAGAPSTNQFTVAGRSFDPGANLAPVAKPDVVGTQVATPVTIDVVANDTDIIGPANVHGINPKATGIGAAPPFKIGPFNPVTGTNAPFTTTNGGRVEKNPDGTLTYTPAAAFSGIDTFPYVVQDTGGCISGQTDCSPAALGTPAPPAVPPAAQPPVPALAVVTVEQATAQATFRPKVQKWDISGTSSIDRLRTPDNTVHFTSLMGAQEVPPRPTAGSGDATVTLRAGADTILGTADDLIDYTLTYTGLVAVQQAHIHNGPVGANGGVNVFLCTNIGAPVGAPPTCPETAGTVTGTLTQTDFISAGAVTNFAELIAAIQAGNTYVNVHTVAFGGGEIRGQLGRNVVAAFSGSNTASPLLGVAAVPDLAGQTAIWSLPEKLDTLPSTDRTVTIQTSAGNTVTVPLRLK